MALTDENGTNMVLPVAPMGNAGNGFGMGDGNGWWILLLFVLLGGWGNGFGGGFGGGIDGGLYPWLNNSQNINDGFRDQMLTSQVMGIQNGITSGFGDVQNSLCAGFAGVNASINGAQNAIAAQMYNNQIADLERSFAAQTANTQGMNALQSQLAQCCCDNRAATADLKYTVATEACADRAAVGDALQNVTMQNMGNTNAIVSAITAGIQSIKDDLCQDRLDAERRENQNLRSELMYARGQASQVEQTAQLLANNNAQTALFQQGFANEVDALYNRLNSCPVPTTPVYGRTPIFTCNQGGCGCGNGFAN